MKDYAREKREKKKAAVKVIWIIAILGVIFLVIVSRFAMAGSDELYDGGPTNNDIYSMAKRFVKPTLKAADPKFQDSGYNLKVTQDSVYIIHSYTEATDRLGNKEETNFTIMLKYKGGPVAVKDNWEMLSLNED